MAGIPLLNDWRASGREVAEALAKLRESGRVTLPK